MTPNQRFIELQNKRLCFQCLYPGADASAWKHKEGKCQRNFVCKHSIHAKFPAKKHALVCNEHKGNEENQQTLELYKSRFISRNLSMNSLFFLETSRLTFHAA